MMTEIIKMTINTYVPLNSPNITKKWFTSRWSLWNGSKPRTESKSSPWATSTLTQPTICGHRSIKHMAESCRFPLLETDRFMIAIPDQIIATRNYVRWLSYKDFDSVIYIYIYLSTYILIYLCIYLSIYLSLCKEVVASVHHITAGDQS